MRQMLQSSAVAAPHPADSAIGIRRLLPRVSLMGLLLLVFCLSVGAQTPYPTASYTLSPDGTTLTKWNGSETEVDLSADEAFAKVTTIGSKAFEKKAITSIVLPNTVTKIDDEAFSECASLSSVTLSGVLEEIGQWGFYNCTSLEHLTLPSSLRRIGKWAFFKCDKLTDVKLPEGLESLGYKAYSGCSAIKEIVIPNSVKEIDIWVFEKCTGLERATFGADVPTIGT